MGRKPQDISFLEIGRNCFPRTTHLSLLRGLAPAPAVFPKSLWGRCRLQEVGGGEVWGFGVVTRSDFSKEVGQVRLQDVLKLM